MNPDEPFRTIAATLAVILFPLMVYFRIKSRTSERLDRRQEGRPGFDGRPSARRWLPES